MKKTILVSFLILLFGCSNPFRHDIKVCNGDYDIENDYKWTYKIPRELVITIEKNIVNIEGTGDSFDSKYQICKETESILSFELNCVKKKESEFKSSDEFVKYLLHTRMGGGDYNKLSGRLELTHLPFGMNGGNKFIGEFRCVSPKK